MGGDVSPNSGILPSNEKEWPVNTHSKVTASQDYYRRMKPDEKSTYCVILYNIQENAKECSDRKADQWLLVDGRKQRRAGGRDYQGAQGHVWDR